MADGEATSDVACGAPILPGAVDLRRPCLRQPWREPAEARAHPATPSLSGRFLHSSLGQMAVMRVAAVDRGDGRGEWRRRPVGAGLGFGGGDRRGAGA